MKLGEMGFTNEARGQVSRRVNSQLAADLLSSVMHDGEMLARTVLEATRLHAALKAHAERTGMTHETLNGELREMFGPAGDN